MTLVLKFSRFPSLSGGILLFSQSGCYVDGLHRGNKRAVGIEPAAGAALSYLSWNPGYIEYHKITRCSGVRIHVLVGLACVLMVIIGRK